jgi:predicted DNA-binding transcriptional regulator AlpA
MTHTDDADRLITTAEVAILLGVAPRTLQAWRERHVGPAAVHLSARVVRYRLGDVRAWLSKRQEGAAA